MPKYIIFLTHTPSSPDPSTSSPTDPDSKNTASSKEDEELTTRIESSPAVKKMQTSILSWIDAEIKEERIQAGNALLEAAPKTYAVVKFHDHARGIEEGGSNTEGEENNNKSDLGKGGEEEEQVLEIEGIPPVTIIKEEPTIHYHNKELDRNVTTQIGTTSTISVYFTGEFDGIAEAAAWAKSCPLSLEGSCFEIREIRDVEKAMREVPELKVWAGEQVLYGRRKMEEEGKLRRDADGSVWTKVEDPEWVGDVVKAAEDRVEKGVEEKEEGREELGMEG